MKRIAVAGFQHETNTFSPTLASFTEFEEADCWPGLLSGGEFIDVLSGVNISITGFVDAAAGGRRLRNHTGAVVFRRTVVLCNH